MEWKSRTDHGASEQGSVMLSALDLARRIDTGELTPADVVDLCAQDIEQRESEIGAFAHLDISQARRHAQSHAKALAAAPLRGLPVGIKDILDTADMPTAYGTSFYQGFRPHADAALVSMTKRAGGNVIGKTVSTPMAFLDPAHTRNPHNPAHTPGGSSSGSAAAVAAGMVPISIGTQTGGSVIRPAAYCGVAGYKPSYRILPTSGIKTFSWSLDTPGLFAAGVADVAFAAAAITGRALHTDDTAPRPLRVGLMRTHAWSEASPEMQAAVEKTAALLEQAGAEMRDVELPPVMKEAYDIHGTLQNYEASRALAYDYDTHREKLSKLLRELLDSAGNITAEAYDNACRMSEAARQSSRKS